MKTYIHDEMRYIHTKMKLKDNLTHHLCLSGVGRTLVVREANSLSVLVMVVNTLGQ